MSSKRQTNLRLGILCAIIIVAGFVTKFIKQPVLAEGLFRITVLDVGQGDAILLDTPHGQHVLLDSGPSAATLGVLNQYLAAPREFRLVIASHNHADHIGGFPAIFAEYPVHEVWLSGAITTTNVYTNWLKAIKALSAKTRLVSADVHETIDGVDLVVLHPPQTVEGLRLEDEHDGTVVVKASYGAVSVLLTGDLADRHEEEILARDRVAVAATILKVAHHGSKYVSSDAFLDAVHPAVAVLSAGADNKFGHPHQATLDRLSQRSIPLYRTDLNGSVQFLTDGARLWVQPERGEKQEVDIFSAAR
jgi:competence protein ComEC